MTAESWEGQDLGDLVLDLLGALTPSPRFCSYGTEGMVLPGLEVEGVGEFGLPIEPDVVGKLLEVAKRAPYGKGEKTLVDTKVRDTFEIEPELLQFHNPGWKGWMEDLVDAVGEDLGIEGKIRSELYKLLIYKKGGFFLRHRDSEKKKGMFGTLVLGLPSRHEGGALLVRHQGEEQRVSFDGDEGLYGLRFAAFYADCEHEVERIRKGFRICLIYNLFLVSPSSEAKPPSLRGKVSKLAFLFADLLEEGGVQKIAVPLAHQYTKEALREMVLKGQDRTRVEVLRRVAKTLGYDCHLATLVRYQGGLPSPEGLQKYHAPYDKEVFPESSDVLDWEWLEEDRTVLESFVSLEGNSFEGGSLRLSEEEMILRGKWEDLPLTQQLNERTGNIGVTMERWYRQSVAVLWPPASFLKLLASQGLSVSIPILDRMVRRWVAEGESQEKRTELLHLAERILDTWEDLSLGFTSFQEWDGGEGEKGLGSLEEGRTSSFVRILAHLRAKNLLHRFLREVLTEDCSGKEARPLAAFLEKGGWEEFYQDLRQVVASHRPENSKASLGTVFLLVMGLVRSASSKGGRKVLVSLMYELHETLMVWDRSLAENRFSSKDPGREGMLERLFEAWASLDRIEGFEAFLEYALCTPSHYPLKEVLIPSVFAIGKSPFLPSAVSGSIPLRAFRRLGKWCVKSLESLTEDPVPEPQHWGQVIKLSCPCPECKALETFLRDPKSRSLRFKVNKEVRKHLRMVIDSMGLDLDYKTERIGSPFTFVCTKNRNSFVRQRKDFKESQYLLERLKEFMNCFS